MRRNALKPTDKKQNEDVYVQHKGRGTGIMLIIGGVLLSLMIWAFQFHSSDIDVFKVIICCIPNVFAIMGFWYLTKTELSSFGIKKSLFGVVYQKIPWGTVTKVANCRRESRSKAVYGYYYEIVFITHEIEKPKGKIKEYDIKREKTIGKRPKSKFMPACIYDNIDAQTAVEKFYGKINYDEFKYYRQYEPYTMKETIKDLSQRRNYFKGEYWDESDIDDKE